MVAIARTGVSPTASAAMPARTAPNLEAQMRTCRAQLADWVTCPSAKTPEGKAKIEQISSKLDSIKDQIKKSAASSSSSMTEKPQAPARAARRSDDAVDYLAPADRVGSHVDTYA